MIYDCTVVVCVITFPSFLYHVMMATVARKMQCLKPLYLEGRYLLLDSFFFRETAKLSVYLAPNDSRLLSSSSSSNAIMGKPRTFLVVSLFGILNHFSWMFWQLKPINYTTSAVFPWFSVGMPTNVRTTTSNEKALKRQWRDKWRLIRKYGRRRQMLAAIKGGISGSENIQICFLFDECHAKNWSDVPYNCRISLLRFTSLQSY